MPNHATRRETGMIGERICRVIGRTTGVLTTALLCGLVVLVWPGQTAWGQTTEDQKLKASDAASSDQFGCAIAVSGDTMVVGAYQDDDTRSNSGSAYVFVYSGGTWTQQAKLNASNPGSSDYFGYAVAISGDTIIVGGVPGRRQPDLFRLGVRVRQAGRWLGQHDRNGPSARFGPGVRR